MSFKPENYKTVEKKVKVLTSSNAELLMKQLEDFSKTHNVVDVIQKVPTMMFVFYME
jgi:DNA integrity scanning protein DisA with diadenylate cyclase activity